MGSSWTRARTHVPCSGRWILNHCATREAHKEKILIRLLGELHWVQMREFILPHPKLQRQFHHYYFPNNLCFSDKAVPENIWSVTTDPYSTDCETPKKWSEIKIAFKCWEALTFSEEWHWQTQHPLPCLWNMDFSSDATFFPGKPFQAFSSLSLW